ncbi:glycosyltransferase [Sphingobium limneticum]|uniref:Glycosyltransferase n=2 Tax=Sphingobium limneticum TaxID=1007511 RepID=A0ABQ6T735_9SPHN|nr:glycosyltransferase [Sphingobium limneticum]
MSYNIKNNISNIQSEKEIYDFLHKHAIILQYLDGKRVLNIGREIGYSTSLFSENSSHVTALDSERSAISKSKSLYGKNNNDFIYGDFYSMPFGKGDFDIAICMDEFIHIDDKKFFVQEVRRVIREDGIFLVSIPKNSPGQPDNAMDVAEFQRFLERHFDHVQLIGVRMGLVSLGFQMDRTDRQANLPSALTYAGDHDGGKHTQLKAEELSMDHPEFILAACSMKPLPADRGAASLFFSPDKDLWLDHQRALQQANSVEDEKQALREALDAAEARLQAVSDDLKKALEDYAALDRRHDDQRQNAASSMTIARLLSRMTGQAADGDAQSIVEQLFVLNQDLVEQRGQLNNALAMAAKTVEAERDAAALREQLMQTQSKLTDTRNRLDREQHENEKIAAQVNDLNLRLVAGQAALAKAGREEAVLRDQLADTMALLVNERDNVGDLRLQLADLNRQLMERQDKPARVEAQASISHKMLSDGRNSPNRPDVVPAEKAQALSPSSSAAPSASVSTPISAAAKTAERQAASVRREMERFVRAHTHVQQQIADKAHGVHDRLPPAQKRKTPKVSGIKKLRRKFDRDASPFRTRLFDSNWLASQSPDAVNIRLGRYLRDPSLWSLDPHPLFSSSYYLSSYPDVAAEGLCPLRHYLDHGWREGRNPHPYFLNDWYLGQNPDVLAELTVSPLEHYLEFGWRENRYPNPLFSPFAYKERYPDVVEADLDPLTHYVVYGRKEKREVPLQSVNPAWASMLSGADRGTELLDFMLASAPLPMPERPAIGGVADTSADWPPERLNDFWIPQKLRDFLVQGGNESEIDLFTYLCSVMEAFRDTPESFPQSQPCQKIHDRARTLSAARAAALLDQPDATIIIPVYNNVIDTLLCIASVLEDATSKSYEIIVADDGSIDATPQIVATLGGVVRYLRQPQNYGFLGNCNEAAKQAKGRHIVLLNNDTLVLPRWLDGLLDMFDQYEKVGLAGSKLISWDGSLQEAGGIYWKDGSAWNFGRGANAGAPEFNYVKDVDYVSGAAIAIPTDIWQAMDGFDDIYAPAYCEDSDIAFRLRDAGYRTLLNPASEVLHHEGRSHGRDLNSGIKAYQVKNQKTFLERWRPVLERDHYPNAHNVLRARDRSYDKKHVLVIDHYVPQWDQDAGSRSTFMCIKAMLNLGYAVTFWPDNLWRDPHYTPMLQEMGVEVIYGANYRNSFADFIHGRADLYDVVFAQRPHIARHYIKDIRENSRAKILYYGHDLHYKRMMAAKAVGEPITDTEIADMRRQELDVCAQADVIFYPDQVEVDMVAQELGGDRTYKALPVYAFEKEKFNQSIGTLSTITTRTGYNLLFVGGFNHTPNQDGILWFVQNILPIIRHKLGNVHLTIVGSKATPAILALASETIDVTGFVTDERLAELYDETSIVIAPLRYGGGVKGKVIEAMATGIPLVTTPIGAQGLEAPEDLMFVASNVAEFADAIIRALTDRSDAEIRARKAWNYAKSHFSMNALENVFRDILS